MGRPAPRVITPSMEDEAAYRRWRDANPRYRYGSALRDAFLAGRDSIKTPVGATVPLPAAPTGDPWEAQ